MFLFAILATTVQKIVVYYCLNQPIKRVYDMTYAACMSAKKINKRLCMVMDLNIFVYHLNVCRVSFLLCTVGAQQGWRSGESARLIAMSSVFDSRTRRHMWVEFVVGSPLCFKSRVFLRVLRLSPLHTHKKKTYPNSNSMLKRTDISERVLVNSLVLRG